MIGAVAVFGLFLFLGWRAKRALKWLAAGARPTLGVGYRCYAAASNTYVKVLTRKGETQ